MAQAKLKEALTATGKEQSKAADGQLGPAPDTLEARGGAARGAGADCVTTSSSYLDSETGTVQSAAVHVLQHTNRAPRRVLLAASIHAISLSRVTLSAHTCLHFVLTAAPAACLHCSSAACLTASPPLIWCRLGGGACLNPRQPMVLCCRHSTVQVVWQVYLAHREF